jgi:hypothetical protein
MVAFEQWIYHSSQLPHIFTKIIEFKPLSDFATQAKELITYIAE